MAKHSSKAVLFLAQLCGWNIVVRNFPLILSLAFPLNAKSVDFWTSRDVREVDRCHLNYAVADTKQWEQSATYYIDTHPKTAAFVKNAGLGFAIPYFHNGQPHDYLPDFIIRLKIEINLPYQLILETKGFDPLVDIKKAAAERWIKAVNADGSFGHWQYAIARKSEEVIARLNDVLAGVTG